jgi:hypothetical protein
MSDSRPIDPASPGEAVGIAADSPDDAEAARGNPTVASLPSILMRTSQDITSALHSLYRSHDFLKQAAVQRLTGTRAKLNDLSTTTETATHRILDGLDNALVLIEEIGKVTPDTADAEALSSQLREEVHGLITSLQFQDIVAQQIAFAVHVLEDTETRIHYVAQHLEKVFGKSEPVEHHEDGDGAFDPSASTIGVGERQSLADSIFGGTSDERSA